MFVINSWFNLKAAFTFIFSTIRKYVYVETKKAVELNLGLKWIMCNLANENVEIYLNWVWNKELCAKCFIINFL